MGGVTVAASASGEKSGWTRSIAHSTDGKADMDYTAYAWFCRSIGYKAKETSHGIWIGPSHGFFNRVPLYETTPPAKDELRTLFRRYATLGVNYAAEPGSLGKASYNYFVRRRNYDLTVLNSKGRWSVRKGLRNCQVRPMSFRRLRRLGMPLNLDTLARQGRADPMFSDGGRWACLCRAGAKVEGAQAWGAFVGEELGAYVILFRIGSVVSLLYSSSRASLSSFHPSAALFFVVTQTMMQTPGVEAVYNGPERLTYAKSLDLFKRRMGFVKEPVVSVVRLRPVASHVLLGRPGRRMISALGRWLSGSDFYQQVQAVLETATLSLEG